MPLVWKNGQKVIGSYAEYVSQLRQVAERADARFSALSDERGLLGDYLRCAADEIEKLSAISHED